MIVALRTCDADLKSYGGFQWPAVGETATATDWVDNGKCGGGLHGLLWGQGDWSLLSSDVNAKWMVFKPLGGIAHLGGKIKCESAEVLFIGERLEAWGFICQHRANLSGADLRYANLRGANLRYADLRGANLRDADLSGADLRGANLRDADLSDANLRYANLRYANLRGADLRYANLRYADLRYANLRGADTDKYTVLPTGVEVPK